MTAPVRIEAEAWADLRFTTLARILGLADLDHALIRCARIWSWQAEHYTPESPTYVVDEDTIESALGVGGGAAMVRSRLAEEVPSGFRIKGTVGRIEWLYQRRVASAKGAAATKRKWDHTTGPTGPPSAIGDQQGPTPVAGPRGPDRASFGEVADNRGPLGPVMARPGPGPGPGPKAGPLPLPLAQVLIPEISPARAPAIPPGGHGAPVGTESMLDRAWAYQRESHGRVRARGIKPNTPSPPPHPAEPIKRDMLACIRQGRDIGLTDEAIEQALRHRVDIAEAESIRAGHLDWYKSTKLWESRSFWRAYETTVEEVSKPRSAERVGPKPSGAIGRVEPSKPDEYPDGEVSL